MTRAVSGLEGSDQPVCQSKAVGFDALRQLAQGRGNPASDLFKWLAILATVEDVGLTIRLGLVHDHDTGFTRGNGTLEHINFHVNIA